ncbi:MAG: cytochrome C oxidase subunit IV family protein [Chromatiales bacterium]|nr:cytochrome C oxidase subunit IV family protein [Chromatiales bacterium]
MIKHAEKIWLTLIGLTLAGAWLAETGHAGWPLTLTVAALIGFKGMLIVDHYMEMRLANRRIRRALLIFISLVMLLVIIGYGWGDIFRQMTLLN